jgi:hypothetical protein
MSDLICSRTSALRTSRWQRRQFQACSYSQNRGGAWVNAIVSNGSIATLWPMNRSLLEKAAPREEIMEASVRKLFDRYERFFRQSLSGDMDMDEIASLYASDFIAASPGGVMTGKNDDQLKQVMAQGYRHYRAIGTKEMRIRNVRFSPIDDHHCVAHVAWTATYVRKNHSNVAIDFDVHYFVQELGGEPKVFGWVSGDEEALLRKHGII